VVDSRKVAVIGAGPAGLFTAHLLAREGLSVTLFEGHSKPGGCASYFRGQGEWGFARFDAGATLLNGLSPGSFLRLATDLIGVPLPEFTRTREVQFTTPQAGNFTLEVTSIDALITSLEAAFPVDAKALRRYLPEAFKHSRRLVDLVFGQRLHWPLQTWGDLKFDRRLLFSFIPEMLGLATTFRASFEEELRAAGLSDAFREWVDMNLLITLQCRARDCYPPWGRMGLFFYLFDAGTLPGGMFTLMNALLQSLEAKSAVFMRTPVKRIRRAKDGFHLEVQAKDQEPHEEGGPFDLVVSSAPRWDTLSLLGEPETSEKAWRRYGAETWSAVAAYLVVRDDDTLPAEAFNFHSRNDSGLEAYHSFSRRGDLERVTNGFRAVTVSRHESITEPWPTRDDPAYAGRKAAAGEELLGSFRARYPQIKIVYTSFATPRTFARYTRRRAGSVGGVPLTKANALLGAPGQRTRVPGLYQVGDTSFPGQSVLNFALGAWPTTEKITGRRIKM